MYLLAKHIRLLLMKRTEFMHGVRTIMDSLALEQRSQPTFLLGSRNLNKQTLSKSLAESIILLLLQLMAEYLHGVEMMKANVVLAICMVTGARRRNRKQLRLKQKSRKGKN